MKSLIALWKILAEDLASGCCTSATMDIKTVQGRSKHEGLSFLTITLPSFGKAFQKGLDQGMVARDMFPEFHFLAHGGLPVFLQGFLELVFDRNNGVLLDEPDIDAIFAVRQLTLIYSKLEVPCSDARIRKSMSDYIQCDEEVKVADSRREPSDIDDFNRVSALLFRSMFSRIEKVIYDGEHVPKHGPGATADKLRGNAKYRQNTWTDRLEEYFHSGDFLFPNARHFAEHYDGLHFLEPGAEMAVNVITVPKTQKTPRIIAIEPTCMQYAQQAVKEQFYTKIDSDRMLSAFIGFESQEPNQLLAQKGSRDGSLATLDLSEASDRVSNQLVRSMLRNHPTLHGAVEACRSRTADVPGHGKIRLAKFASMGSALCFPVEAMVFLTIVFVGIERSIGTPFSNSAHFERFIGSVRVYGDDIIVPVDHVHSVIDALEAFGSLVGVNKSFWIGRFRESCGKEYFDGQDVSIVKVRRLFPTTRKRAPAVIKGEEAERFSSLVSLRNQLYLTGQWKATRWLDAMLRKSLKWFPNVTVDSAVLGRVSFLGYQTDRICENLHAPMVKGYVDNSRLPSDVLDGSGALLKFFLKRGSLPTADRNHLERAGRPRSASIKTRLASPF